LSATDSEALPWHEALWQRLAAARRADRLPHALLLAGPAGLGKSRFARRLSNALVCPQVDEQGDPCGRCGSCRQAVAGAHPDQLWLAPEEPGKPIKIDAVRRIAARSTLSAGVAGYRVVVIDPADALNRAAANALLKTLEEPVSRSVLVLVSSHPDRLMATVRSRCQLCRFVLPPPAETRRWLAGRLEADADALLAIGGGAPLRALQAGAADWPAGDRRLLGDLADLRGRRVNPTEVVSAWAEQPLGSWFDGLGRCLVSLIGQRSGARQSAYFHPGVEDDLQNLSRNIDLSQLFELYDELMRLQREASNHLNQQMLLEHIATRWLQITRNRGR
jgi:DNA polymerase-3 subunit delta'